MLLGILFFLIASYLLGSLSSAITVCKIFNLPDPRLQGSGNPGATNVLRLGGKLPAGIVLICDILKGVLPVVLARSFGITDNALGFIAAAAVIGHIYPVFFQFEGGKGVATVLGGIFALSFKVGCMTGLTWVAVAMGFGYSSLASLVAIGLTPIYAYCITDAHYGWTLSLVALLIIGRHKQNIQRLLAGTETKIGKK